MTREDAIEEIKQWDLTPGERETLEAIIPELRESEDERMLRTIIRGFENWKSNGNLTFNNTNVDDILSYLEKQKEQLSTADDIACAYQLGLTKGREEQKPTEWSEEDEKMMDSIINELGQHYKVCTSRDWPSASFSFKVYQKEIDWLKSLRPSWKPSEEQMMAFHELLGKVPRAPELYDLYNDLEKLM